MKFSNKTFRKAGAIILTFLFALSIFSVALAQTPTPVSTVISPANSPISPASSPISPASSNVNPCDPSKPTGQLCNPLSKGAGNDIFKLVATIVDLALTIASIAVVLYLIYIGFQYVMARGNENELKKLHETLIWTFVGIAIIFGAKLIVAILQNTINALK
ncbi:MAG: hypothetical protein WCP15_02260 [bacterium]